MTQHARMDHLEDTVERLEEIAYLHRASAHVMAGWNVKIPELDVKLGFARHAFEDMDQAQKLDRHIWALTRASEYERHIPQALREFMLLLDKRQLPGEVAIGLYVYVKPKLLELYEALLPKLHHILDATPLRTLTTHLATLREQCQWGRARIAIDYRTLHAKMLLQELAAAWSQRQSGRRIKHVEGIWAPLDRPACAVRPGSMPRALPGSLRLLPLNGWTDPEGIGLAMHNQLHGEFTTMELMSRCLYEHPDMPAAFHLDMARHASDEARHAMIFQELASRYSVHYGDYPVYTLTYDGYYEFEPVCQAGTRQELLWRLILRGTVDEGLALDDLLFQAQSRRFLQQDAIATACRYILADETFHVQGALRWTRYLCENDEAKVVQAREQARRFLDHRLYERRLAFEQQHADAVAAELAHRKQVAKAHRPTLPFIRTLNTRSRMAAGYTEADLKQIVAWGYANAE